MKNVKVIYLLTEEGRKDSLINDGDGKRIQVIETEATAEILRIAKVNDEGEIYLAIGCEIDNKGKVLENKKPIQEYKFVLGSSSYRKPEIEKLEENVCYDSVQALEQLIINEENRLEKLKTSKEQAEFEFIPAEEAYKKLEIEREAKDKEERATREANNDKWEAERKANDAKRLAVEKANEEAKKVAEIAFLKNRATWIAEHGNQYLKDCLELKIDANREYVIERASLENPDFLVDYNDNANWEAIKSPSQEAITELKRLRSIGVKNDIVWLTRPANVEDYRDSYFEEQEAIVIREYLGKYDLIKIEI